MVDVRTSNSNDVTRFRKPAQFESRTLGDGIVRHAVQNTMLVPMGNVYDSSDSRDVRRPARQYG